MVPKIDICILLVIVVCTFMVRVPIAAERKIMPAGDAFNFQHIASQIPYMQYPSKEKRLPVYPIFILFGRTLGFDPIATSIGISIIASTGTIIALYGLGRVFRYNRAALVGFLGLAIFDPLLISNGIRPLSDGLFVFLIASTFWLTALFLQYPGKATKKAQILYSIIITLLMFTRYEGFLIAALTAPFLFIKLPSRQVAGMAMLPMLAIVLWIPAYISIHGSLRGLSYVTDATNPNGGFGELSLLPENFDRLMNGSGFKRAWAYPQEVFEHGISTTAIKTLIMNPNWWVGVLSILGLIYIVVVGRFAGLSIIVATIGYALLLSWWWVYSRYVAPLSIIFYFGAAGGLSILTYGIQIMLRNINVKFAIIGSLVPLLVIPMMLSDIPHLHASALSRAWEGNRKGYALYRAILETAREDGLTVYPTKEHANATLYFGIAEDKKSAKNPAKGLYLSDWKTQTPNALYDELAARKPRFLIETDFDTRLPELTNILRQHGNINNTHTFRETLWDTLDTEITHVYEFTWP